MKKLITAAVASAFAFLAIGAVNAVDLPSGTSLEDLTAGEALDTTKDDYGVGSDSTYWYLLGDDNAELLVTNYEASVELPPRPAQFADETNNNFLKIDTNGRLYRSIGVNDQSTDFPNPADIGDGIYLDTLVQFTAADDEFKEDALAGGDKIAIEYVEREEERNGNDEITVTAMTNFVIRAGYIVNDYSTIPTNYYATVPAGFNKEDWHRLTVRAVASIAASGNQKAGFIVYLDGVALEYSTDVECGVEFAPANAVAEYYKADCHAIYPSAVQYGTAQFTLSAVAFKGNGCVDDISFTDQTPGFIGRTVTFDLGTGEAVTMLTVNGTDYDVAGVATTNIENLVETFTIAVTPAENYNISVISNFEGCTYTPTTKTSGTVTLTAASATVKVITTRDNFDYTDENGDPQTAVTLTDAFAKVGAGGIISLKFNYNVADWEEEGFAGFITGNDEYVLDLKGHTLNGGDDGISASLITVYGTLTIKDSVGGGEIIYDTQNDFGIVDNYGTSVLIGSVENDRGATFTGKLFADGGEGDVIRGSFDVANNDNSGSFLWAGYVAATSDTKLNQAETYWVVTPAGGGSDTPVAVPTPLLGIIYDGTEKTGVVAQVGYTLSGNTAVNAGTYEAIAMLQSGFVWSDDNTKTNKTISWSIAADHTAVVDVTLASEIAEWTDQLEFPTVTANVGNEAVTGTPEWDPAKISEPNAGETNTYTVTFTVMNGNYTGSTGTAEFKVYKAASGSNWPAGWNSGNEPASMVTAFNTWIAAGNDPTAANAEAAFLVGVNVADYTNDFAAASITIANGKVVITGNYNLSNVNGALAVKMGDAPNALGEPTAVTAVEGAISLTPALGETKKFYKLVIGYPAN